MVVRAVVMEKSSCSLPRKPAFAPCSSKKKKEVKFVNPLLRSPIVSHVAFETMVKLSRCTAPPLPNWAIEIGTALHLVATEEANVLWDVIPSVGEGEINVDSFTSVFPVLYHVLSVVPAYQASIGPALNELCLGLLPEEVSDALFGVYAKDVHVRMACLNAIKCIPAVSTRSLTQNVAVATSIWIALHDPEKSVAEVAEDIWDRYGYEFGTDYSGVFRALSHVNYNVRMAAAEALAAALDENPDTIQESLLTLFSLYIRDGGSGGANIDAG